MLLLVDVKEYSNRNNREIIDCQLHKKILMFYTGKEEKEEESQNQNSVVLLPYLLLLAGLTFKNIASCDKNNNENENTLKR